MKLHFKLSFWCFYLQIDNSEYPVLITEYNDLGNQRFYDPYSKQSFKYDHLRKEAHDYEPYEPDAIAEPWRLALQEEILAYTESYYRRGACSVFAKSQGGRVDNFIKKKSQIAQYMHYFYRKYFINRMHRGSSVSTEKFLEWTLAFCMDCKFQCKFSCCWIEG